MDRLLPDGRRDTTFELNLPPNLEFPLGANIPDMIKLSDGGILLPGRDKDTSRAVPIKYLDKAVEELPTIFQISDDQNLIEGQTLELEVFAEASSSLQYQWHFNGDPLEGANAAKLAIENVGQEHEGAYWVDIESESGALTTSDAIEARIFNAPAGRIDPAFENERQVDDLIHAVAVLPDDRLLVGGGFHQWNGREVKPLIRLNPDGSFDESFQIDSDFEGEVWSLLPMEDGRVWAGGSFEGFGDFATTNLVRLQSNGEVDETFQTESVDYRVEVMTPHSEAGLYAGGLAGTDSRVSHIAQDGTEIWRTGFFIRLGSFSIPAPAPVHNLVVLPDGDLLVAGVWNFVLGIPLGLVRFEQDGALDDSWPLSFAAMLGEAGAKPSPVSIRIQRQFEDRIIITGNFFREATLGLVNSPVRVDLNGNVDPTLNKDHLSSFSEILFVDEKNRMYFTRPLIRVHEDGSPDPTFEQTSTDLQEFKGIAQQSDGGLLVWGLEEGEAEAPRSALLRLLPEANDELRIAGFSRETNPETQEIRLALDIQTQANAKYILQYKNELSEADWTTMEQFQGDGDIQTFTAEPDGPRRYFRVKEESL